MKRLYCVGSPVSKMFCHTLPRVEYIVAYRYFVCPPTIASVPNKTLTQRVLL